MEVLFFSFQIVSRHKMLSNVHSASMQNHLTKMPKMNSRKCETNCLHHQFWRAFGFLLCHLYRDGHLNTFQYRECKLCLIFWKIIDSIEILWNTCLFLREMCDLFTMVISNVFSLIPKATDQWFRNIVRTNKETRSKGVQSHDLFHALLQIQEKHGEKVIFSALNWKSKVQSLHFSFADSDETFLAGHSLSLYLEGSETSATSLSFVMYHLARNPECQERLYDEIVSTMAKHGGQLTFEALQEMIYLEGVILEAMRLNPPVLLLSKLCSEKYTLPKTSSQTEPVTLEPGTVVQIPVLAVHM